LEANEIISSLFRDHRVDKCISKFVQPYQVDDLKQDLFETLLKKDSGLIIDLHKQGNLFFYTVIVIKNLCRTFNRQPSCVPFCEIAEDIPEYDNRSEVFINHFNNLDETMGTFYYKELVKVVAKHGSINKAAKAVGIPVSSVRRDMIFVREYLKSKM